MNNHIHYFGQNVWITATEFHCEKTNLLLDEIDSIHINFRVNTTIISFLSFLASFAGVIHGYFKFGDWGYLWLIPLVATFGWVRYMLLNYVELVVESKGKSRKIMVTSMRRRHQAYEIEDYVKQALEKRQHNKQDEEGSPDN